MMEIPYDQRSGRAAILSDGRFDVAFGALASMFFAAALRQAASTMDRLPS
jgi:hypothetical protein